MIIFLISFSFSLKITSKNQKSVFDTIAQSIQKTAAGITAGFAQALAVFQLQLDSPVTSIRSNNFNNVFLRVDGSNCSPNNVKCGHVNAQFTSGAWEKWVFQMRVDKPGTFCVKSQQWANVYLYFDASSCHSSSGPGCGSTSAYYSTSCTDNLLFITNRNNNALVSYANQHALIRIDGSGLTRALDNGGGNVNGQYYNDINTNVFNGSYENLIFTNAANTQQNLMDAVNRYRPTIYIHESEHYFPISIEALGVNWSTANGFNDENARVRTNPNAGMNFNGNAPLYVSVKNSGGNILITYAVLQSFNDCGPQLSLTADVITPVSTTGINDLRISPCPAGKHNSDLEHIQVTLDSNFNLINVIVAYHSWDATYAPNEISFDGTHPIVYMALGSHAHYRSQGEHQYTCLWNERAGVNSKCVSYCWDFIPCGFHDCFNGAQTMGCLMDFTTNNMAKAFKYATSSLVVLKSDFWTVDQSGWSQDLKNFAKYKGRLGEDIVNNSWNTFQNAVLSLTSPVRAICSSCDSKIRSGLNAGNDEMQSAAPGSLAGKSWF